MRFKITCVLALSIGWIAFGNARAKAALADDPKPTSAEEVLKDKSLRLVAKLYILEDESAVGAKLRSFQNISLNLQAAMAKQAAINEFDQTLKNLRVTKTSLQLDLNDLNIQLDAIPNRFNNRTMNLNSA